MANPIFDGLPDLFVGAFGESVIYIPRATGVPIGAGGMITAIWTDGWTEGSLGQGISNDAGMTTLSVRSSDVVPVEGDTAQRVADGKVMIVSTPIRPDGKGMIDCNLTD